MQAALQRQYELYQQKQQQQWQSAHHQPQTLEEVRTLWIGDLKYWMEENYIHSCFAHTNEVVSVKIIRNKLTGLPEGYGFIEFTSHAAAERVLHTYSGTQMPQTEQLFRLNWASFGMGDKRGEAGPDHSIFVGDLAPDVTDYVLQETFRLRYPSVRGAKVVMDAISQRSKGYGFVRFGDESEKNRAMTEMNGVYCSSRPMRISTATPRKAMATLQQTIVKDAYLSPAHTASPFTVQTWNENDPNNAAMLGAWGQDPTQWNNGYYAYGQGFEGYTYDGFAQDPSQYGYTGYHGYPGYPQQAEGEAVPVAVAEYPPVASEDEVFDPLAPVDIDKLNDRYISLHESSLLGCHLWLETSEHIVAN
ncbi:hypothetical protein KP509_06G020000 [Ceratopteris richardii]|uniref:RRM domain-containing protein n=1 Tax=Ceratopteris richardii TaxID=49495 RepID=A0A8T2UEL7_CERRI|nr:hypothetical protein KP509_06G020000 [Ceratopteris richardii]